MLKLQRISQFQFEFNFHSPTERFNTFYSRFLKSDLGKIHQAVPWDDMVNTLGLKNSPKGPDSYFSPRGKLALMFLKHYARCSDYRLIEQLNGNVEWQYFCDISLGSERLTNSKIVSRIRCEIGSCLDIHRLQKVLYEHWKDYIPDKDSITMDATCYESYVRRFTYVKLLWECVYWMHAEIKKLCKAHKLRMPRSKYSKWLKRYAAYSCMRKKPRKEKNSLRRSLILLLGKLIKSLDALEKETHSEFTPRYYRRRAAIRQAYWQQYHWFHTSERPKNLVVSIDKPYIRPIVRGKEIKPVEYGAKSLNFQISGISFIEHLSFDAFHEGIRFKQTVFDVQSMTKKKLKICGIDAIFGTNANRRFITGNNIRTDLARKGRAGKHEHHRKQMARIIAKERSSRMEGSFGKEKEHYLLGKIKARTRATEVLWIFFGVHTPNALEIGRRMSKAKLKLSA